ncbi:Predicted metal-dependent phosphohydrolase, HD superfamily [Chitinophaga jiangningensis]|uniref:Predicted metal-dependent phosphohydrolase, HD superfamily n=1 Tax=Chitinophaga jiangningensis TaxID=1419482 RepID=A0A1M7H033_9BACT|nr:Pycsar system effector family protein [Chitinophaga jiangningensis]SHM21487.1 Predicted metal-dependent phosphohydrolase, HD superfamily [Chitinophaga jiangningensis]
MQNTALIDAAREYILAKYRDNPQPALVYHNLTHTQGVVDAAAQIAAHYRLQDDELTAVYIAAWFHDEGYLEGDGSSHEEAGAEEAVQFLREHNASEQLQQMVSGCILATKMPQSPNTLIEQIVCDADLFHLGSKEYAERSKLLRHEVEMVHHKEVDKIEWLKSNIRFLTQHQYWTDYARTLQKQQKDENIKQMQKKLDKKLAEEGPAVNNSTPLPDGTTTHFFVEEKEKHKDKDHKHKEKEEKAKKPDRGVETMFRITSTNHIRLSSMADSKAHIMISVNSIILSIMLTLLIRRLEDYPNFIIPSLLFVITSVTTVIFAVLATRPNVTSGTFTRDDISRKDANLLFFGNFHKMTLEEYEWGMKQMMNDADFLYGSMTKDVYHLGVVLGHKYRLLRISYNVFMFGLILSVLAFLVAAIFFPVKA